MQRHGGSVADTSLAGFRLHARRSAAPGICEPRQWGGHPGLTGPSFMDVVAQWRMVYTGWQAG